MAIPASTRARLATQLDVLEAFLDGLNPRFAEIPPGDGGWSAKENVAHLARHAHVFLERLERILQEDRPDLGTYLPDQDPEWRAWRRLPLDQARRRLAVARAKLLAWVDGISDEQSERVGVHPMFGPWKIDQWLKFFLLHEAHHLYFMVRRLGQAQRSRS